MLANIFIWVHWKYIIVESMCLRLFFLEVNQTSKWFQLTCNYFVSCSSHEKKVQKKNHNFSSIDIKNHVSTSSQYAMSETHTHTHTFWPNSLLEDILLPCVIYSPLKSSFKLNAFYTRKNERNMCTNIG